MRLAQFLVRVKGILPDRLRTLGDSREKLYAPKVMRDSRDRSRAEVSARIMGVESGDGQEVWLTVWSKEQGGIGGIEKAVNALPEWEEIGDRNLGERLYRKPSRSIVLGFDEDGSGTLIYEERGRRDAFTGQEYSARVGMLLHEMLSLLT